MYNNGGAGGHTYVGMKHMYRHADNLISAEEHMTLGMYHTMKGHRPPPALWEEARVQTCQNFQK